MPKNNETFADPRIAEMARHYVNHYMAHLGPFVSSVFFHSSRIPMQMTKSRQLILKKSIGLSIVQIADMPGMSKRKSIDSLRTLKDHWIIMWRAGSGRGNVNRYYFLPCETWFHLGCPDERGGTRGHERPLR